MKDNPIKRLFIGIRPDIQILKNVELMQGVLIKLNIDWIPLSDLHLTIIPPWVENRSDEMVELFSSLKLPLLKSDIILNKIEFYDPNNILWARGSASSELLNCKKYLHEALNIKKDDRPFILHLTLAKHVDQKLPLPDIDIEWNFKPTSLTLFESIQTKRGTNYEAVAETQFLHNP